MTIEPDWHLKHEQHGNNPWAVQREAIIRANGALRYGYHLEQGLGKSPLSLNDFVENLGLTVDLMLVFVPNSFKLDWPLLPALWGVPEIKSGYWPKDPLPWKEQDYLYAINYESVSRSNARKDIVKLIDSRRVLLILDETSAISNPKSATSQNVFEAAKGATMVRVLNGTPLIRNPLDFFFPMKCLGQYNGWNPYQFRNRYCDMGGHMGKVPQGLKKENEAELMERVDSVSFRAMKKDWRKDLPPQISVPVHLEMTSNQIKHYREMMNDFFTIVEDMEVPAELVLTQMDKLRQITSGIIMYQGDIRLIDKPEKNPKVISALDLATGGSGKTIVVYTYRPVGDMLFEQFSKAGFQPAELRGQMKPETLIEEKRRFNQDPDCRAIIVQQAAGSRGHDLIGIAGDRASKMVFYENSFSLLHRLQMWDRNHRGDQDETCWYYDLLASPMDEIVMNALGERKSLADYVDNVIDAIRQISIGGRRRA